MIPRVPKTKGKGLGKSFKGTIAYLMHDERKAKTADRVLWSETLNLGVDDPELASRVMAATAMDADRLKRAYHEAEQAKLPEDERTPYKASKASKNHVYHYSLAWDGKNEGHTLSREEMMRAARGSLRALGADDLQAVVVAHAAETNPHVHIMVNRIDPVTGRARTPESNAQFRLSDWALQYERDRGFVLCEQRAKNADYRAAELPYEQYTPESRKAFKARIGAEKEAAIDPKGAAATQAQQVEADKALGAETRQMREDQRKEWQQLGIRHRERKKAINDDADQNRGHAERVIKQSYTGRFDEMREQQAEQMAAHQEREKRLFGKIRNITDAVQHVYETRGEEDRNLLSRSFEVLGNSGARLEALKRTQEVAQRSMKAERDRQIDEARREVEATRKEAIHANYERYGHDKAELVDQQAKQQDANRQAWHERDQERATAWSHFAARTRLEQDYANAAGRVEAVRAHEGEEQRKNAASRASEAEQRPGFDTKAATDTAEREKKARTVAEEFGSARDEGLEKDSQAEKFNEASQDVGYERSYGSPAPDFGGSSSGNSGNGSTGNSGGSGGGSGGSGGGSGGGGGGGAG